MHYPTIKEVKQAGMEQLADWYYGLPMPGHYVQGSADHPAIAAREQLVLDVILRKYHHLLLHRRKTQAHAH